MPGQSGRTGYFVQPVFVEYKCEFNLLYGVSNTVDQPVNAGFSWTDGEQVASSEEAAGDVYNFLQLFLSQYKQFSKVDFYVTGESYAGVF